MAEMLGYTVEEMQGKHLFDFIRLRRIPRACPWMNAQPIDVLRRDVRPRSEADNRGVAAGEAGYFNGTTGLPVGLHGKPSYLSYTSFPEHDSCLLLFRIFCYQVNYCIL